MKRIPGPRHGKADEAMFHILYRCWSSTTVYLLLSTWLVLVQVWRIIGWCAGCGTSISSKSRDCAPPGTMNADKTDGVTSIGTPEYCISYTIIPIHLFTFILVPWPTE